VGEVAKACKALRAQAMLDAMTSVDQVNKIDKSSREMFGQVDQAIKSLQENLGEVVKFVKMLNGDQEKLTERVLSSHQTEHREEIIKAGVARQIYELKEKS